jgi:predicted nucleic acid-binding protein
MSKPVFIDTNVILDVLGNREPFYQDSASVLALSLNGECEGFVSAITFNNIFYLLRRTYGPDAARKKLAYLRDVCSVIALDQKILNLAIDSDMPDFEDAIQYFSALHVHAEFIVTRNKKHFAHSEIPVLEPGEYLKID